MKSGFKGISYTIKCNEEADRNPSIEFNLIRVPAEHGASLAKDKIHYGIPGGGNSGYQAVNLAYILGAKTILLLGFDMFGTHYFGKHPKELDIASPFGSFIESFETIDVKKLDIEIINCSRSTALACFPRKTIDSVLY